MAGEALDFALYLRPSVVTSTAVQQTTLPIWMLGELVRPRQRPVTDVVAVFLIAVMLLPILVAYWDRGTAAGGRG